MTHCHRLFHITLITAVLVTACSAPDDPAPAASGAIPAAAITLTVPPEARVVDVVDTQFGLDLPDPYRWMEGVDNDEFQKWLNDQGAYAREQLDALPTLSLWQERLADATRSQRVQRRHQRAGSRVFFIRQEGDSTGVLMLRERDGSERLLLDPAGIDGPGRASIVDFAPSPDGHKVAVGLDRDGNEISQTRILDVATTTLAPKQFGPGLGAVSWLPDGEGFIYLQFADGDDRIEHDLYQNLRLRLHRFDADAGDDPILLKSGGNPSLPLTPSEFSAIVVESESNWTLAFAGETRPKLRLCVSPRGQALAPDTNWRCLAGYDDGVTHAASHGDTLFLQSISSHPNGRLLALDLSKPDAGLEDAYEILPESPDTVLSQLVVARDALYVKRMRNGVDGIVRIPHNGGVAEDVETPMAGTISAFSGDPDHDGVFYSLQGWTSPETVYSFHPGSGISTDLGVGSSSAIDASDITSVQIESTSADGTRVPLTVVHRGDIRLDGSHRAVVVAYGGYGYSIQPFFDPTTLEWVKAGNVIAVAHVRGGGEKGEAWRLAGHGINKRNGVDDVLASIDTLIERGYTARDRVGLRSVSAGGLLIGGALAQAPERFAAAFIGVGWFNPVRVLEGQGGAAHVQESADPRTPEGLRVLAAIDPYLNLRADADFPPVMLTVGLNDPRVPGWEAGKFAARLQALSRNPVLLSAQPDAGHFATTLDARAREMADEYAFFDAFLTTAP